MSYYTLRLFIKIIVIFILSFLYFKLKISKHRIIYIIISTLIVIAVGIGLTFPIENLWKTFKTVEDAFNYKYPEYDIIKKYEGQKLTIVLVNNDNNLYFEVFKKSNDKFKLSNSFFNKIDSKSLNNSCLMSKIDIEDNYFINISCIDESDNKITYKNGKELEKIKLNNIEYYCILNKGDSIFLNEKKINLDF